MQTKQGLSLDEIRAFLKGSDEIHFEGQTREEVYGWVNQTLHQQAYEKANRAARGLLRRYIEKMTGLSRAQVTRLITPYQRGEEVKPRGYRRRRFPSVYTRADVDLLASVDEAHETLSGPATQKILQRAYYDYGDKRYERLAGISVAQLYRLRQSAGYRKRRLAYQPTRSVQIAIGERRAPQPNGRPGYLRVDTVHQGDLDGVKGVYHINAVDEVTQWQILGATDQISEAALEPVLMGMLEQFPFRIRGFHSDNGSEYINRTVASLLNKLLVEQTKSRPRRSNDNALAESKNGAVVRKHMGYGYIAAQHAKVIDGFYRQYFNPYLNFHRPCGVPERTVDRQGRSRRKYHWYATPWEILCQLPDLARALKPEIIIAELRATARAMTDTQAAAEMQEAKRKLFARFQRRSA